ncbi:MAG TPA: VTT domain-containing protein [Flavisolibacter sp.]|jgi:membrane-associated protein|nr:VTT domain-containing protein [Flavisolibacter sp.]
MLNNLIDWIIENGGIYILLLVVFAETGLFVGFFLPGDSLLFAAGIKLSKLSAEFYNMHFSIIILLVVVASVLGNMVGYWFGYKTGPILFERRDTWLFKKKHLVNAKEFYEKNGKGTIFLAKFLPIIRTFAPIVAGVVKMNKATFIFYNILGSIAWVSSMMLGGYFLETWVSEKFGFSLARHIEVIAIAIIMVTTLPVIYKIFFAKNKIAPTDTKPNP